MEQNKQIEEEFEKYSTCKKISRYHKTEFLMDIRQFQKAIASGDLYTKKDVERKELEAEIKTLATLKEILAKTENTSLVNKVTQISVAIKLTHENLETQLKELQ